MQNDRPDRIETPRGEVEIIPPGADERVEDWRAQDWRAETRVKTFRIGPVATILLGFAGFGIFVLLLLFFASALAVVLGVAAVGGALAYVARKLGLTPGR